MAITAAQVKELREASGAGMMECKKALTEADGNMDAAIEILKKSGAMKAAKKASRIAAEGLCDVAKTDDGKTAAVVEVNSETDFVAKNEKFKAFVGRVAAQALKTWKALWLRTGSMMSPRQLRLSLRKWFLLSVRSLISADSRKL